MSVSLKCSNTDVKAKLLVTGALKQHLLAALLNSSKEITPDQVRSSFDGLCRACSIPLHSTLLDSQPLEKGGLDLEGCLKCINHRAERILKSERSILQAFSSALVGDSARREQGDAAINISGVLESGDALDSVIHQSQTGQVLKSVPTSEPLFCDCSLEDAKHSSCCGFREISCPNEDCGEVMSANKLPSHDDGCPEKQVPCPCECGLSFKRKSVAAHTSKCPFRLVECAFRCVGCNLVTMAKDMDEHVKAAAPQHCILILGKSQEQDREIAQASQLLAQIGNDSDTKYAQAIAASEAVAASINQSNATAFKRFKENERACKDSINLLDDLKSKINTSASQIDSLRSNVDLLKQNVTKAFGGK